MNRLAKKLVKAAFRAAGFELRYFDPLSAGAGRLARLLEMHEVDTVLDIGAHTGEWVTSMREAGYQGPVISFEPMPAAHERLCRAASRDGAWVIAPPMAIGEREECAVFNVAGNSVSSSLLDMLPTHKEAAPESVNQRQILVEKKTLDSLAGPVIPEGRNSIFCKVDVQGYEKQVLQGARAILPRIAGFQLELSLVPLYDGGPLYGEMLQELKQFGFDLFDIYPAFVDPRSGRVLQVDGVFFRRETVPVHGVAA